jgi:acyl-CoA synthetase (AMP-forming)/AMP-acid ligase II
MNQIADRGLGQQLIASVLTTGAVRHAEREAVYCSATGRRFTFRELNVIAVALAFGLRTVLADFQAEEVLRLIDSERGPTRCWCRRWLPCC